METTISDTNELVERLRYVVENPSAWDAGFDQRISDLIAKAVAALAPVEAVPVVEPTQDVVWVLRAARETVEELRERARTRNTGMNIMPNDCATMGYYGSGTAHRDEQIATIIERLAASQAETRRLALEEAATLAAAFADSEEVEAIAGLLESKGVGSPGWRKDAMHSHAQEVSERISTAIRTMGEKK